MAGSAKDPGSPGSAEGRRFADVMTSSYGDVHVTSAGLSGLIPANKTCLGGIRYPEFHHGIHD